MNLRSQDVPQAPRLDRVRSVVDAVAQDATTLQAIGELTSMKARDARYHLNAATRALDLLEEEGDEWDLTELGERLAATEPGSEQERHVLVDAVSASPVVRELAGDLLGPRKPRLDRIERKMRKAGLGESTAKQRAKGLLSWRDQLAAPEPPVQRSLLEEPATLRERSPRFGAEAPQQAAPHLEWIRLVDFKSFVAETVPLAPLTVFVGANASGKSNALDAIRFLQGIGLELPVSDVLRGRHEGGREIWPPIRGGIAEACRYGTDHFQLETQWRFGAARLTHLIRCGIQPVPLVHRESLVGADMGDYLFDTQAKALGANAGLGEGRSLRVALKRTTGKRGRNPNQTHSAAASLLGQVETRDRVDRLVGEWVPRVQSAMKGATFLSISPAAMRDYAPQQALEMGADGRNISAIVKQLCEDPKWKQRIVDWLSELCAPQIKDITFVDTDLGDVMLQLVEADGTRVSARSLSDGTLRFLGELVALLTAPAGSVLLIEEIENGLHPQRLSLLVQLLEGATRDRRIQVIVTTHSPLVLAALSDDTLANAVVFARVSDREGTVARRLGDLPHFHEVAERRGVDGLFAAGWLEQAL